jgi:hypothetical protein
MASQFLDLTAAPPVRRPGLDRRNLPVDVAITEKYFTAQCSLMYSSLMQDSGQKINRLCSRVILVLSIVSFLMVLSGYTQPPQKDEGTAAHIFQISIVLLVPAILLFLATADWTQPLRSVRPLALPSVALVLAFGALYYLEHYGDPNYVGRALPTISSPTVFLRARS